MKVPLSIGFAVVTLTACAGENSEKTASATALLEAVAGVAAPDAEVQVELSMVREGNRTTATLTAKNCAEGAHAVHIHRGTRCGTSGSAAGPKWMPAGPVQKHGGDEEHDDSSLGRIYCKPDGTAYYIFASDGWALGEGSTFDPGGHAVVLYGVETETRIACGILELD